MAIQIKRGTEAKRQTNTTPLSAGQPVFCTDSNKLYIADEDGDLPKDLKALNPTNI